jgi:hypothetical protein
MLTVELASDFAKFRRGRLGKEGIGKIPFSTFIFSTPFKRSSLSASTVTGFSDGGNVTERSICLVTGLLHCEAGDVESSAL